MIAKCTCQNCGVNIEFDVEMANTFYPCPECSSQTRLVIPSAKKPEKSENFIQREISLLKHTPRLNHETPPKIIEGKDQAKELRQFAERVAIGSYVSMVIGTVCFIFTLIAVIEAHSDSERLSATITGSGLTGGFLFVGVWLFLTAQIMHIRANTHRE